jgi:L-asparaginase II
MKGDVELIEVTRGDRVESVHRGHIAICDGSGQLVEAWGEPETIVFPRSSCKMVQTLPLIESGAADAFGLGAEQIALACASHIGAPYHTRPIGDWLAALGLDDDAYQCGRQPPEDAETFADLIRTGQSPCRIHNNCSGKHTGFLTLAKHLGAGPDYVDTAHPVQKAVLQVFEDLTGEESPGFGIDGCSAPNFTTSLHGLARAAASFATAHQRSDSRAKAQTRIIEAMMGHPHLVSGYGTSCTELMRLAGGKAAVKKGADGMYVAILPEQGLGIAIKMSDGSERGRDPVIANLLDRLGVLPKGAATEQWTAPFVRNWDGIETGLILPTSALRG